MFNFINNISSETLIALSKQYCNLEFTKEEIDPILPYLKNIYYDYYHTPCKRNFYREKLREMTSDKTYQKIILLLEKFNLK